MNQYDELDQQLWEFVYDLLPEQDYESLRDRIRSDPAVARAYARVKLQSELVAQAARAESAEIPLPKPAADERAAVSPGSFARAAGAGPWIVRVANGLTALAATALICLMGYGLLRSDGMPQPPGKPLGEPILAQVSVPDAVRPDAQNWFFVQTAHPNGTPRSGPISYRFYDDQRAMKLDGQVLTNAEGWGQFTLPASLARSVKRLEVVAGEPVTATVEAPLAQSSAEQVAYLALDKKTYLPDETVHFRATVLGELELLADRQVTVEFDVLGPGGGSVLAAPLQVRTERGIAAESYTLPPGMQGGQFTVALRSPEGQFASSQRSFTVRSPRTLNVNLQLARQKSAAAAEVLSQVQVYRANGEPAVGARLEINAVVAGQELAQDAVRAATDDRGQATIRLGLPEALSRADGELSVRVQDGGRETQLSRQLPPLAPDVAVDFVPEGGALLSRVDNRVFFASRDAWGQPVELNGRVLDNRGRQVALAQSLYAGKGVFQFTPQTAERYVLAIDQPSHVSVQPELPPVSDTGGTILRVEPAVVDPGGPLNVQIGVPRADACVLVAAYCRGAMVGQQLIDRNRFTLAGDNYICRFELFLAEEAAGAIRVAAFDCTTRPAEALAERLAFRYPSQRLHLRIEQQTPAGAREDIRRLQITAIDEAARPVQAVLSVGVLQDELPDEEERGPTMAAHYFLANELDRPDSIGDGLAYLETDTESRTALELLLGTQRVRKFRSATREAALLAQSAGRRAAGTAEWRSDHTLEDSLAAGYGGSAGTVGDLMFSERAAGVPAVFDNRAQLIQQPATISPPPQVPSFNRRLLGQMLLLGGALLAIGAVMLALFRLAEHAAYLLPVFATAGASLLVGLLWLRTDHDALGRVAQAPAPATRKLAEERFGAPPAADAKLAAGMELGEARLAEEPLVSSEGVAPAVQPTPLADHDFVVGQLTEALPADAPNESMLRTAESADSLASGRSKAAVQLELMEAAAAPVARGDEGRAAVGERPMRRSADRSMGIAAGRDTPSQGVATAPVDPGQLSAEADKPMEDEGRPKLSMRDGAVVGGYAAPAPSAPEPSAPSSAAASAFGAPPTAGVSPALARGMRARSEPERDRAVARFQDKLGRARTGTTLYWNPQLVADENGQATIDVPAGRSQKLRVVVDAHAAGRLGSLETTIPVRD